MLHPIAVRMEGPVAEAGEDRLSEQALRAEAERAGRRDEDVVGQQDVDGLQRVPDAAGHLDVASGRFHRTARMIMDVTGQIGTSGAARGGYPWGSPSVFPMDFNNLPLTSVP